jgi:hypothetical protein
LTAEKVKSFRVAARPAQLNPKTKRQRAGAVQNASRGFGVVVNRASVLECGGPPPFSAGESNCARVGGICYMPAILLLRKKVQKAQKIFFAFFAFFAVNLQV